MPVEIRPELDAEHKAVLADWLEARGDPRGELISLEIALEHGGIDPAPLQARLDQLRAELEPRWVAELAAKLQLTPAQLHVFMPGRWYAGLLLELALCPQAELAQGEVATVLFEWILASEASVALERIDAGELPGEVVLEQLATGPVRERIRKLVLGDHVSSVGELALLNGQLPGLRELEVRGTGIDLTGFAAPELEHLRLCLHGDWGGLVLGEVGMRCPKLERLELRFGQPNMDEYWGRNPPRSEPPSGTLLREFLVAAELPALVELGLAEFDCEGIHLAALATSGVLDGLRRLTFAGLHPYCAILEFLPRWAEALADLDQVTLYIGWTEGRGRDLFGQLPNLVIAPAY